MDRILQDFQGERIYPDRSSKDRFLSLLKNLVDSVQLPFIGTLAGPWRGFELAVFTGAGSKAVSL